MTARELQERATALFSLAEDAFGRGKTQLGEELTALAIRDLDEADALETIASATINRARHPAVQQQQQVQPGDN